MKKLDKQARPLIGTDGVFATMGNLPQLKEYADLARAQGGVVFVDESHAVGTVGKHGRGAHEYLDAGDNVYVGATLSKGICTQGAIFAEAKEIVERAATSTVLRGSSKGALISAAASAAAMKWVRENPEYIAELGNKTNYLREKLRGIGLNIHSSPASIVSFAFGEFETLRNIQTQLFEKKIYVLHSNYIAAGPSGAIRMSVFGDHTYEDLDRLVDEMSKML